MKVVLEFDVEQQPKAGDLVSFLSAAVQAIAQNCDPEQDLRKGGHVGVFFEARDGETAEGIHGEVVARMSFVDEPFDRISQVPTAEALVDALYNGSVGLVRDLKERDENVN